MKRKFWALLASIAGSALLSAYNPPAGGQNVLRLSEPQLLAGGNSAAGGGLFGTTPASIVINPALTAWEQRSTADLAGTVLYSSNSDDDGSLGSSFQAGLLIPSRWFVSTFLFQGTWAEFLDMPVGDSINFMYGYAKDITETVSVGLSANFGYLFGDYGNDWTAGLGIGAYYSYGDWKSLKNIRFGASLTNLGKMYSDSKTFGFSSDYEKGEFDDVSSWPAFATLRTGAAATFIETDSMDLGLSLDFSYPSFQDFVIDAGLQMEFAKVVKVYSGWQFDVREFAEGSKNIIPSIGVSFKFQFNSQKDSFLGERGWEQSEMTVSAGWKQLYENINAFSAGAVMNLGLKDTAAPEIKLWGEN